MPLPERMTRGRSSESSRSISACAMREERSVGCVRGPVLELLGELICVRAECVRRAHVRRAIGMAVHDGVEWAEPSMSNPRHGRGHEILRWRRNGDVLRTLGVELAEGAALACKAREK